MPTSFNTKLFDQKIEIPIGTLVAKEYIHIENAALLDVEANDTSFNDNIPYILAMVESDTASNSEGVTLQTHFTKMAIISLVVAAYSGINTILGGTFLELVTNDDYALCTIAQRVAITGAIGSSLVFAVFNSQLNAFLQNINNPSSLALENIVSDKFKICLMLQLFFTLTALLGASIQKPNEITVNQFILSASLGHVILIAGCELIGMVIERLANKDEIRSEPPSFNV